MATPIKPLEVYLAVDADERKTVQEFDLGATLIGPDENGAGSYRWVYVQANGAIAASQTDITVDAAGQATDGAGDKANTLAFADNEFGWVRSTVPVYNLT